MHLFRSSVVSFLLKTLSVWPSWEMKGCFCFTQHTGKIIKELDNLNVNVDNIELLDKAGRENLQDFAHSWKDAIDYSKYLKEVWARYTCMVFGEKLEYHIVYFFEVLFIITVDSHSIKVRVLKASSLVASSIFIVPPPVPACFHHPQETLYP